MPAHPLFPSTVCHTFFSRFAESLEVYGARCTHLRAEALGSRPTLEAISEELSKRSYKMVTITQVDTSTGVLMDVEVRAGSYRADGRLLNRSP